MSHSAAKPQARTPLIVATGFTSALLGDERTLREFVVGDAVAREHEKRDRNVTLYLINDTYDPLNIRQLRLGVDKDPELIEMWSGFCGRPIAEVPDPYACHDSYAEHFASALLARLRALDIHPVLLDSYRAYTAGDYKPFMEITHRHYGEIQSALRTEFPGFEPRDLIRVQCARCSRVDATGVRGTDGEGVAYECRSCGFAGRQSLDVLRGKLTWKLDCAARWNIYGIHVETFAKPHMAPLGSFSIASFISKQFFGGVVPEAAHYGHVRISSECSGHLLEILPPAGFKHLLGDSRTRDLLVTRDSVESFGRRFEVRPGVTYADYVRSELPRRAIQLARMNGDAGSAADAADRRLVAFANHFSAFCYGRTFGLRLPSRDTVAATDGTTAALARDSIGHALALRRRPNADPETTKAEVRHYLATRPPAPGLHRYLRRIFGQEGGPTISTLLAILPDDYLEAIHAMLVFLTAVEGSRPPMASSAKEGRS